MLGIAAVFYLMNICLALASIPAHKVSYVLPCTTITATLSAIAGIVIFYFFNKYF